MKAISVNPKTVYSLRTPTEFYDSILNIIKSSSSHLLIAALYLGCSEKEKLLVDTLQQQLKEKKQLSVQVLLDHSRGTRGLSQGKSSLDALKPLLANFGDRSRVSLFHNPLLRFPYSLLPERKKEIIGVQHGKCVIGDNNILLTGANMSTDYFTNRQDRYLVFENQPDLARFYEKAFGCIIDYSHNVALSHTNQTPFAIQPNKNSKEKLSQDIDQLFCSTDVKKTAALSQFENLNVPKGEAFVVPTIFCSPLGITQEQTVLREIFRNVSKSDGWKGWLATAYYNLSPEIEEIIQKGNIDWKLLTSAPEANGFFGSAGMSSLIPTFYSILLQSAAHRFSNRSISIMEYNRNQWTFHGKGIWLKNSSHDKPMLSFFGSSNYGVRSFKRDLELGGIIVSNCEQLNQRLDEEINYLYDENWCRKLQEKPITDLLPNLLLKIPFVKSIL